MSIKCKKLGYIYGQGTPFEFQALKDVDLEIEEGSFTAIIGQTGSGKSTFIQHINALLLPTEGEIQIDEYTISALQKPESLKNLRNNRKRYYVWSNELWCRGRRSKNYCKKSH